MYISSVETYITGTLKSLNFQLNKHICMYGSKFYPSLLYLFLFKLLSVSSSIIVVLNLSTRWSRTGRDSQLSPANWKLFKRNLFDLWGIFLSYFLFSAILTLIIVAAIFKVINGFALVLDKLERKPWRYTQVRFLFIFWRKKKYCLQIAIDPIHCRYIDVFVFLTYAYRSNQVSKRSESSGKSERKYTKGSCQCHFTETRQKVETSARERKFEALSQKIQSMLSSETISLKIYSSRKTEKSSENCIDLK